MICPDDGQLSAEGLRYCEEMYDTVGQLLSFSSEKENAV